VLAVAERREAWVERHNKMGWKGGARPARATSTMSGEAHGHNIKTRTSAEIAPPRSRYRRHLFLNGIRQFPPGPSFLFWRLYMTVHHGHVPLPLLIHARASWCGWRYEARDGKQTKVPIDPHTGRRAKTNDSTTWSDNETALAAVEKYGLEGVGYVFSEDDPFRGIDIDNCRNPETGSIAPWAQEMTASLTTYTEVSPSGTGLKCW